MRLCDLYPDSLDFDFTQLSSMMHDTRRLLAVVPTHLFGAPSDVPRSRRLFQDSGVTIVEDAAQAMGESWQGRKLGTLGDVGFFSLGRGKAFSTVEGGVILTDRDDIAEVLGRRVESLPGYGFWRLLKLISNAIGLMLFIHPRLFWIPRLLPFLRLGETRYEPDFPIVKMTSFQAGLASGWQRRIEDLQDARTKGADRWHAILGESKTHRPCIRPGDATGLLRFPIRVSDKGRRESLLRESDRRGLGVMPVYPTSIDAIPEARGMIKDTVFPVAARLAQELVTLPTHGYVGEEDIAELRALLQR
jgi:dTDP-4-amino-4,6-dideoxygalactose transaminase